MRHPRRLNRQRSGTISYLVDAEVQRLLVSGKLLGCNRFQRLKLLVGMRRSDVLDLAGAAPRTVHNLYGPST